ncbi:MAG: DUF2071 domain-containing protein [Vicinamibacterales bacterium]
MHPAFVRTDHRPFPLPAGEWVGRQSWHDLLFAHWPVPAAVLQEFVPAVLEIQAFEGTSWVGLLPFGMRDVALRGMPALPWLSAFPEINLRLYVEYRGRPGIWFISLDASRALAVWAARTFVHLPYFLAHMKLERAGSCVHYSSVRDKARDAAFEASYWPTGTAREAKKGSLEYFLTERYALYSQAPDGRLWTVDIHHQPWPLQPAAADLRVNTVASAQGLPPLAGTPLLHFSRRQDVATWPPRLASRM